MTGRFSIRTALCAAISAVCFLFSAAATEEHIELLSPHKQQIASADIPKEPIAASAPPLQETRNGHVYREIDIPYPKGHPLVEKYRNDYLSPYGRKWLASVLKAGAPIRPYIRRQLQALGLPSALEFLPVVESDFIPTAVSRSGATGLWQFMENSIHPFLTKNEWIDERYDPWKSTDAALKKLKDNYRMFQDWPLAIAAYNCGAGAMGRALKQAETPTFWYLAENNLIKNESIHYVPKLIAVADVVLNSGWYGIDLPEADNSHEPRFEEIVVNGSADLDLLAQKQETGGNAIKKLNLAVRGGVTPPDSAYRLRIPAGTRPAIEATLKRQGISVYNDVYTVKKGDTLWGISRRYGISVKDLCIANNIDEKGVLPIGRTLVVPIID